MHLSFARTDHRPWPLPKSAWTWRQSWRDLLFIHWPVPAAVLRPLVPAELEVQEFDGTSWVGVVPFRMTGVMRRPFPDMPGVSAFPELNVRLYVETQGKPGVWFLSLDATNPLAVWAARKFFHLPYYRASITLSRHENGIAYRAQRSDRAVEFAADYKPIGETYESRPGTLEHWLTERYCLYARSPDGRLLRNDVHHVPWPLFQAEADIKTNSMVRPYGISLPERPPLLHFSPRIDVVVWDAEQVL